MSFLQEVMVQRGPFFLGEDIQVEAMDLIDELSKEFAILALMPSFEPTRPTLDDTENIDRISWANSFVYIYEISAFTERFKLTLSK